MSAVPQGPTASDGPAAESASAEPASFPAPRPAAPAGWRTTFVVVMAIALALYIVVAGDRAIRFLATGEPLAIGAGVALIVVFAIGAWALVRELVFGFQLHSAVQALASGDGMPEPLPATASGRADRASAEEAFPVAKADVEAHPESWESWLRLSMAYDAARDRRRARMAARRAITLRRNARRMRDDGGQEAP